MTDERYILGRYILDGKTPVRCDDLLQWAQWYQTTDRHVAEDHLGDIHVSTVFLGLDHQWGDGPPLLFETMIFGGRHNQKYQRRCSTWDEAVAQHAEAMAIAKSDLH